MEIKLENLLSVRVGRVMSRNMDLFGFVSPEEYEQFFADRGTVESLWLPEQLQSQWRLVPSVYFNIYLGEVFSFYLTCTNDSIQEIMTNVTVRIDMQTNNRAIFLKETTVEVLDAKNSLDMVLSHEIKEPFTHVLICTMSFNIAGHERQTCRKFFQFPVSKPIDVKTKYYYTECEEIYLEALFQNLTTLPIQLKSVVLESGNFDVTPLNYLLDDQTQEKWIFGQMNRLNSQESRQYLFILKPKPEIQINPSLIKSVSSIGKLDIVWYSGIGERGHIQTSQLERTMQTGNNIKIVIDHIPTQVFARTIFKVKLLLTNCSAKDIEPIVEYINTSNQNILWLGISSKRLGTMKQLESTVLEMSLFAYKSGLHSIPSLKVTDSISRETFDYNELAFVQVGIQ